MSNVPPKVLDMVFADGLHKDPHRYSFSVLGIHRKLIVSTLPHQRKRLAVYLAFTNGHGKTKLKIQITSAKNPSHHLITPISFEIDFPDPIAVIDIGVDAINLTFDHEGSYRFELIWEDKVICSRDYQVEQKVNNGK